MKMFKALILGLALLVPLSLAPSMAMAEKTIVLRFAHHMQDTKLLGGEHFLADEVYKRTNGKVKIELYFGETLGKATELFGLLRDGAIDIGSLPQGYHPSQFPLWSATSSIPFLMKSNKTAMEVARRIPNEIPGVKEEFLNWKLKYLNYTQPVSHYGLFSSRRVATVDDLKGLKVRTFGVYLPRAMHAVGAVGVTLHPAETYEALKRGVIDASLWDISGGYFMRNHEIAPHFCQWDIQTICGYSHVMSLKVWNSLPVDVQRVILEVEDDNRDHERKRVETLAAETADKLRNEGAIFHPISDSERQKWIDKCPNFVEQWVEKCENLGKGDEARKMRDLWLAIIAENDK